WPTLPQEDRGKASFPDYAVELAAPNVQMQRRAVQDITPLPPAPMCLDEERLAVESPVSWNILLSFLTGLFERFKLLVQVRRQGAVNVEDPRIDVRTDDGRIHGAILRMYVLRSK